MKLNLKKIARGGIAAGVAIFAISFVFDYIVNMALPYDMLALGGMRAIDDPLMLLFFLQPWVLGFAMATAFEKFKGAFRSKGWKRGKAFAIYVWLLVGLPSAFIVFTSRTYPIGFTVSSLLGSLFYLVGAGIVLEKTMV